MERAARVIKNNELSQKLFSNEDLARAVWPSAVGKKIAGHTSGLRLVRSKLVVEVADATWQRQLFPLTSQILDRLRKAIGSSDTITDIEFRIAIPRRLRSALNRWIAKLPKRPSQMRPRPFVTLC